MAFYDAATRRALATGYTGLRVVAEVSALAADPRPRLELVRWEHLADGYVVQGSGFTAMCVYRSDLPAEALADVAVVAPARDPCPEGTTAVPGLLRRRPRRRSPAASTPSGRTAGARARRLPAPARGACSTSPGSSSSTWPAAGCSPGGPASCAAGRCMSRSGAPPGCSAASGSCWPSDERRAGGVRGVAGMTAMLGARRPPADSSTRRCSTAATRASSPASLPFIRDGLEPRRGGRRRRAPPAAGPAPRRARATTPPPSRSSTWPRSAPTRRGSSACGPTRSQKQPRPGRSCAASASPPSTAGGSSSSSSASCTSSCSTTRSTAARPGGCCAPTTRQHLPRAVCRARPAHPPDPLDGRRPAAQRGTTPRDGHVDGVRRAAPQADGRRPARHLRPRRRAGHAPHRRAVRPPLRPLRRSRSRCSSWPPPNWRPTASATAGAAGRWPCGSSPARWSSSSATPGTSPTRSPAGSRRRWTQAGGRGLYLVHQLCDLVQVRSSPRGHDGARPHLALTPSRAACPPAAALPQCRVMTAVEVHDCTPDRWDDVVAVFEGPATRGGAGASGSTAAPGSSGSSPTGTGTRCGRRSPSGCRGCSATWTACPAAGAPSRRGRPTRGWPAPGCSPASPPTRWRDPSVWSVTCFVVRRPARRRGLSGALLAGAVDLARRGGRRGRGGLPGGRRRARAVRGPVSRAAAGVPAGRVHRGRAGRRRAGRWSGSLSRASRLRRRPGRGRWRRGSLPRARDAPHPRAQRAA